MVVVRRARAIRGQRHAKLLLGIAEVPHHGAQGEPEHPRMSLLADGRESHANGSGANRRPPGLLESDDFQTFNGYAMSQFKKIEQDIRNHGEVRWKHAMHLLPCCSPVRPPCARPACPCASRRTVVACSHVKHGEVRCSIVVFKPAIAGL